jgi:hypothetical protein
VSHHVERKVRGALHADSFYWTTDVDGQFVKRKPLADLSPSEIDKIRDGGIKRLVIQRLEEAGIDFGRGTKLEKSQEKLMKVVLANIAMKSGVPVKKVRLLIPEKTIRPIRRDAGNLAYVKPDSTHHLCLFRWQENGTTKCDAVFITMLDAADRINQQKRTLTRLLKEWKKFGLGATEIRDRKRSAMRDIAERYPVIQRDATKLEGEDRKRIPPEAEFVMSLSSRELILLEIDGQDRLYSYNTAASTTRQMSFYPHTAAKCDGKLYGKLTKYPNSLLELNPRKVTVDPLGRIRWAND